jgi:hypothetical protein
MIRRFMQRRLYRVLSPVETRNGADKLDKLVGPQQVTEWQLHRPKLSRFLAVWLDFQPRKCAYNLTDSGVR